MKRFEQAQLVCDAEIVSSESDDASPRIAPYNRSTSNPLRPAFLTVNKRDKMKWTISHHTQMLRLCVYLGEKPVKRKVTFCSENEQGCLKM